jgi:hypothetical protein
MNKLPPSGAADNGTILGVQCAAASPQVSVEEKHKQKR